LLLLVLFSPAVWAVAPLVDSDWLAARLGDPKLVLLDIQPSEYYRQVHLPGAVHAPYALWRTSSAGLPEMLPPLPVLEDRLGRLGIAPDDTLLLVVTGFSADEMAAAARVYWTLKVLGHRELAILNGGLAAFAEDERRAALLTNTPADRPPTRYEASPDLSLLADADDTLAAIESGQQLIDARTRAEYLGIHVAGEGERPGTLPTAKNLPFDWLTENGSAWILPTERLRSLMQAVGVATDAPQVHFCHSGNRAALNWFVAHALLGNGRARLYDGSILEWGVRRDLPMERQVDL
jgi:thiosulfate/3-mercaptopyruvate sulfurtransferase